MTVTHRYAESNPMTPDLFGSQAMPAPRSRRTDPDTSHIAAERHSEALKGQAAQILRLIERWPGSTACELAKLWRSPMDFGSRRVAVSRRTADLEHAGRVRKGAARVCSVKGSKQVTWHPADFGGAHG